VRKEITTKKRITKGVLNGKKIMNTENNDIYMKKTEDEPLKAPLSALIKPKATVNFFHTLSFECLSDLPKRPQNPTSTIILPSY